MYYQVIVTLIILAFMVVMLLTHKLPYGLTGIICCTLFVLFGIADIETAFSGFSSSTAIMVMAMIVVATQLSRTSVVHKLKHSMEKLQGKSEFVIVLAMLVITALLSQFMGQVACISIMLLFCQTLDENSNLSPSRMLFAVCCVNTIWTSKIPIAMGATMPGTINAFFEGVAPEYAIGIGDYFKAAAIPAILGLLYCLFFNKLIPNSKMKKTEVKAGNQEEDILPRNKQIVVYAVFVIIMAAFFLANFIPKPIQNIIPLAGVLVFILTGVVDIPTVIHAITGDIIFLIAGMSAISTILGQTGVGELIGQGVLKLLGGNPAPIFVVTVFTVVTAVMTNFLSNMGTMALMIPIAASTALAGGFNVQTVVLVTAVSSWMAFVFPTGCSGSMIAFGTGNYDAKDTFKFTIPLFLLEIVSLIISTTLLFPIYG